MLTGRQDFGAAVGSDGRIYVARGTIGQTGQCGVTASAEARQDTNARFGETNQRLDRFERRQTETEGRLSTELVAVVGAVHEVRDLLREDRALRSGSMSL
jgi:hypothetical protein